MHAIGHNSASFHWIPTKTGTEIALITSLRVLKFSLMRVCVCVLWQILQSMQKEVEKRKKKGKKLWPLISRKRLRQFPQIWYVDNPLPS